MATDQSNSTIGVVGLGKLGKPIVRYLNEAVHTAVVFDIDQQSVEQAVALGPNVQSADSIQEVGSRAQIVFVVVGFDDEVRDVCAGVDGLLTSIASGCILVVCSTVHPSTMHWIARRSPNGVAFVDAPLCRGEKAAQDGELLALVGGSREQVEQCTPLLKRFCSDVEHLGSLGAGQVGKALNNFLLWSCTSATHEAMELAGLYGLETEKLQSALLKSSGENWALRHWRRHRKMPWAEKDMMIVLDMADERELPMPMAGLIKEHIKLVKRSYGLSTPKSTLSDD